MHLCCLQVICIGHVPVQVALPPGSVAGVDVLFRPWQQLSDVDSSRGFVHWYPNPAIHFQIHINCLSEP